MTKEYKHLANYATFLANTTNYDSWDNKSIGIELMENLDKLKDDFPKDFNFNNLTDEELKLLRFRDFDDNSKNLIPLWIFRILDEDTKLISFSGKRCIKKDADDDIRYGCTAYMLDFS